MIVFLARKGLKGARRIVIKLGTNIVINQDGRFNSKLITSLLKEISLLRDSGKLFILVSSGAIGLGNNCLNWKKTRDTLLNQCSASVGQSLLMHEYGLCSKSTGMAMAQVLLTREDLKSSKRKERIKNLIEKLTALKILAIINENDSVSTEEITFGDNDLLSAYIAQLFNADLLILLSNVDGVYKGSSTKEIIPLIRVIDSRIKACITGSTSSLGRGGMLSKILAAEIASPAKTVVAKGNEKNVLARIFKGENIGTLFHLEKT